MSALGVGALVGAWLLLGTLPWLLGARPPGPGHPRAGRRGGRGTARHGGRTPTGRRSPPPDALDPAFVLDLCAAAVRGGAAVPVALAVTGRHLGGPEGEALVRAGTALGLGAPWDAAWAGAPASIVTLAHALRTGRDAGAAPGPQLHAAAAALRRERRSRVRAAAGALGVRLTLPLGLCFLPAFVLLGLVPVVLGLAGDLVGLGG